MSEFDGSEYGNVVKDGQASYNAPGWWADFRHGFKDVTYFNPTQVGRFFGLLALAFGAMGLITIFVLLLYALLEWMMT